MNPDQNSPQPIPPTPLPPQSQNPVPAFQDPNVINSQPQPVSAPPPTIPVVNTETSTPTTPFFKNKIFLIATAVIVFLLLLGGGVFAYLNFRSSANNLTTGNYPPISTVPPYIPWTPQPEKVCNSPLAPAGAGPVSKCNYRDSKISVTDAQAVYSRIYKLFGVAQIPSSLNFHQTTYKGITIKWTDNQPISDTAMTWIKNAIDIMPGYYYVDHPVLAIYSATPDDLQVKGVAPEYVGAIAYASGLNIFITKDLADGKSSQYVVNQAVATHALFHEWTHIIQFYDTLQTFTEDYLSIPGNATVVMGIDPLTKDYAKAAGWVFQSDQYGDSEYAILGTDASSQKQSDYGKTKYIEDMAEAGADFMSCHDDEISEARIAWWEKTTGTNRNSYCPAKF